MISKEACYYILAAAEATLKDICFVNSLSSFELTDQEVSEHLI